MTCTRCKQPIAMYHRTSKGPHHLTCPPVPTEIKRLLIDADSALSFLLHRKRGALDEISDGRFTLEVAALVPLLRKAAAKL